VTIKKPVSLWRQAYKGGYKVTAYVFCLVGVVLGEIRRCAFLFKGVRIRCIRSVSMIWISKLSEDGGIFEEVFYIDDVDIFFIRYE
jgi:hypothetical protein